MAVAMGGGRAGKDSPRSPEALSNPYAGSSRQKLKLQLQQQQGGMQALAGDREACAETTGSWLRWRTNRPAAGRTRDCGRGRGGRKPGRL